MAFSITPEQAHEKRWWTLGALCLSLSIIGIDNTILNVALPLSLIHISEPTRPY